MSIRSHLLNIKFTWGDNKRDVGLTTPGDIVRFDNIRYGKNRKYHLLDIYKPKDQVSRFLPVIISIHGGGWVYGDKERYQYYCMSLAQRGFAVVNCSYRLAPANRFPAQMQDINQVINWVLAHSAEYGLDSRNIFLVGDSAGAHMAALYCCACTNPEYGKYAASQGWKIPAGFVPRAVALNCGIYEFDPHNPRDRINMEMLRDLLDKQEPAIYRKISPLAHVERHFPPVFLMTSKGDFLREQAARMAQRLKEKNIPFTYKIYGTSEKPLPHVFHCNIREPEAAICNDAECSFFKELSSFQIIKLLTVPKSISRAGKE